MTDHTITVPDLADGSVPRLRLAADAAFGIPGVRAVGIDRSVGTLTVTSSRPITATELTAAITGAPTALAVAWSGERAAARAARKMGDPAAEWRHLERAHILSQPNSGLHVRTHLAMLRAGIRRHDTREIVGQLLRLVVAGPGSLTGRYPVGNTGGADVNALTPMPIPDDLVAFLPSVTHIEEQP
jgi:Protein of unknown function (DUF3703)